ncbi:VPLPA-CTERM sorting domain-containing protein [Jannaschia sp. CCS1]|uniref:VPLPA-CTERM sorting domain-containing protein n=1 Tax=Jannaschia sp. (strain CCS1) TaxID=290400 RepID=UPI000053A28A|nr:VPLPA-CTERM sorting domain-containing protein [Jannaschia sp. CCS1]ABD55603.1 hypothetical protein Jann_2686 [Jannaschia sp. CCS1]
MKHIKSLSAALVAVALTAAAPATATPVNLDFQGSAAGGSQVAGGPFNTATTEVGNPSAMESFIAWCIEITQFVGDGVYERTTDFADTGPAVGGNSGPGVSFDEQQSLSQLFTQNIGSIGTSEVNTAFQMAIWEIIYDSSDASNYDLSAGNYDTGDSGNPSTASILLADSMLMNLSGPAAYNITYYTSGNRQDLITGQLAPVPLPAGVVLLLGGLGAFGVMRRRQKTA